MSDSKYAQLRSYWIQSIPSIKLRLERRVKSEYVDMFIYAIAHVVVYNQKRVISMNLTEYKAWIVSTIDHALRSTRPVSRMKEQAFDRLSESSRLIVILKLLFGYSYRAISRMIDKSTLVAFFKGHKAIASLKAVD